MAKSKKKSEIGKCHYHICGKKTKIHKCKYCGKYFCSKHLKSKPAGIPRFNARSQEDRRFMEEWEDPNGHPCMSYMKSWKLEIKKKEEKYYKALDKICKSKSKNSGRKYTGPIEDSSYENLEGFWSMNKGKMIKIIGVLFVIGLIGYYLYSESHSFDIDSYMSDIQEQIKKEGIEHENLILEKQIERDRASLERTKILEREKIEMEREYELLIHTYTNEERRKYGLEPLYLKEDISIVARLHSQDMIDNDFFKHDNLKGQTPTDRGNILGVSCVKDYESYYTEGLGENIFYLEGYHDWDVKKNSKMIVDGWMTSEGHRENILEKEYDQIGIGVKFNYNNIYATQNFC